MTLISREERIQNFVALGLKEDIGDGDHTTLACIDPASRSRAKLLIKEDTVFAGKEMFERIFLYLNPETTFDWSVNDGDLCNQGDIACYVGSTTHAILMGERLALNTIQRMCGIATMSRSFKDEIDGLSTKVLDTRKTTPLIRFIEKWAVEIGGCTNYRFGLFDRIMIKDNHIEACGGLVQAVERVHEYNARREEPLPITVEVKNMTELSLALDTGGIDQIMLDNHRPEDLPPAIDLVGGRVALEASGGINLQNLRAYAETGIDYVSSGALTHSVMAKDISLKIV